MRSMMKPASRRRFGASRFLWTTSLVGSLFGGAGQAMAQTYPGFGTVDSTAVSNIIGDVAPTISSTPTALSVALDAKSTVINWQDFNVPAMTVADFNSARTDQISVLNRVIGNGGPPTPSQIDGLLTASNNGLNNISLFLVNPSGVMFGADGSYSGGSLVLSTLDITPGDFNDLDTNYRIFGGSTGALTLLNGGGTIAVTNGAFVAVGETLSIDKSVTATGGDVALVTASDIDLSLQTSSPLAIKINAGTTLGTATIGANGQLTGNSVMFAGASTAMASLLNVDSGATLTATDANGRVIISAGKGSDVPATAAGQAVVSYDAALAASTDSATFAGTIVSPELVVKTSGGFSATSALDASGDIDVSAGTTASFANKVTAGGNLMISGDTVMLGDGTGDDTQTAGGDVAITSGVGGTQIASSWQLGVAPLAGAVTFDGDVTAAQDFLVNTTGTASILGNVSAGRNYRITGGTVMLGNATAAVTQRANGSVAITSTAGGISASAPSGTGITLNSDFNVSGAESLSVSATGGGIDLGAASSLVGTSIGDPRANVLLDAHGDATAVGAIYADQLLLGASGDFTAGGIDTLQSLVISTDGAVSLKGINVRNPDAIVLVKSTGAAKDVTIDGNITGPTVSGASGPSLVIVQAGTPATGGKATLTGGVASRGGLLVEGGTVELGGSGSTLMSAFEGIAINAGSGGVKGNAFLTLQSDLGGTTSADGNTNRLQIESAGDVDLGANSRLVGGTSPNAPNDARQANVIINAPSSAVTVGRIEGFNLNINAAGGVANLAGAVSTLNDVSVVGGTVNLGDGTGSDSLLSGRNLTVSAGSGGTQIASNWTLSPVPGTITFSGDVTSATAFTARADGAVSVGKLTANSGGITLRSNLAAVTASGALSAPGDIAILAATNAQILGDVSAGASYGVSAQSVLLGNSGGATQTANTGLSIVAGSGGVNAVGALTLQSDADGSTTPGTAFERLQIDSGGSIDLGATSRLIGGATPGGLTDQRQALVSLNAPTGSVRVGQVDANVLVVDATGGSATLAGPVSILGDLLVLGTTVNLGDGVGSDIFTIGGGIFVRSGAGGTNLTQSWSLGASTLTGPVTFQGDIFGDANFIVNTAGAITLDDVTLTGANRDISLVSTGSTVSAGSLSASRSVIVDALGTASVAGNVSVTDAGGVYVVRGDSVVLGATGQTVSQTATGDVLITARNSVSDTSVLGLGTIRLEANSDSTGTEALQVNSVNGGIFLGGPSSLVASRAVGNGSTITVAAGSGKPINIGAATGDRVQLFGTGDIMAAGAIASNQGFSVATSGAIDLQGVNVTDPSAGITLVSSGAGIKTAGALVAPGDIVISASGAALVLGSVAAGGNYGASGSSVQLSGLTQSANGVIQIQAGAGGVSSLGDLTLRSNADGSPVPGERLEINSGGGVALATASLFGGTNRQSNVIINAASANALTVKGVEANNLFVTAPSAAITVTDPIRTTNALSLVTSQAITLGIVETTDPLASVNLESGSGDVTLNGTLLAGGNIRIVSGADIRSQDMTSANGSISLTAADSVLGLSAPETLPAGAGGNRVDAVTAGGAVSIIANQSDVRATSLASANGNVAITVAGSLTGLATGDPGNTITGPTLTTNATGAGVTIQAANIVRLNSVQSAGAVTISQASTGGVAIGTITATGSNVSIDAGTSGFFLGSVDTGAGAGAVSLTSGLVTSPLTAPQYVASPATLIDAGFGRTTVAAGGSVSIGGASGLLRQLGTVTTGTGAISVTGQGFTATTLTAANAAAGTISVTANNGGLYLDSGTAGAGISLIKTGGTAATTGLLGDEIRVSGALTTTAGDVNATSATNARLGNVTASNGSVIISATTGVLGLGTVVAGNSIALASAGDMNVQDLTANEDLGLQAGGVLVAQNLAAGDDIVASVAGTTNIVSLNQPGNAASPVNVDTRRIVFGGASLSIANGEDAQLGRRNVVIDSGGNLTLGTANATDSMALRSGGTLTANSAIAGEDFAARAAGNISLSVVQAGDDADVASTGGTVSLPQITSSGTGDDSRQTDLSGAGIVLANGEQLVRSNILVDAGGNVTLGVADAKASLAVRASGAGSITGTSLTAGEDIALSSGGTITATNSTAGDDIDVTAAGDASLVNASATGLGIDDRRVDFSNASRIGFGAETLGRSDVALVTDGNATLGTVNAVASIGVLAKGATSAISGATLTAGEDIAFKSTLGTAIATAATAGDDAVVLSGTAASLPNTVTTGLGADDREVTFASGIGFANADGYGRSNILVDAGANVTLGVADAKASLVARAAGSITGTTLTASEDIALSSGGTTTVTNATAGDDVDVTALGDVALTNAVTTGLGIDDRRVDFSNASRIGFGAETLGRSNVALVTDGNATLGTVNAVASIGVLAKGATSTITGNTLTAGEDIALKSTMGTTINTVATAGDDVVVLAGTTANLPNTRATGLGADDREVTLTGAIGFANTDSYGRGNIVADVGTDLTLGTAVATGSGNAGSVIGRAGGTITASFVSATQDFALQGGDDVTVTKAFAGDDIELVSTGGSIRFDEGAAGGGIGDDTRVDFGGAKIAIASNEDHLGHNLVADALTNITLGTATTTVAAQSSLAARATNGSITGFTLAAGEDFATYSGGATTISAVQARDDVDVTALGDVSLTDARTTNTGPDNRRVDFGNTGRIGFGAETLGRSNVAVVTDGNATLGTVNAVASIGVLAKGASSTITGTTLTAGEDIALKSTLSTTIVTAATAGDDVVVLAGTAASLPNTMTTGLGADNREVTFAGGIGFANTDGYSRSNILVDAGGSVTLGVADAKASLVARAAGTITGATLTAGEDIALSSGGTTTVTNATAGDDIDVTATGDAALTDALSTGAGADNRRVDFSNASRIGFGAETLGRSNVAVVTDGNATLGTADAVASVAVLAKGATSVITGTSLTAGEDIALKSTLGTTIITSAKAGDDAVILAGTTANLPNTMTTGLGADDREVTFTGGIGFANADGYGRSNILVDAGSAVTLGVADAKASLAVRAAGAGSITGTTFTAGEDIALSSGGATSFTTSVAGDDIDVTTVGDATLTDARSTGAGADNRRVDFSNASRIGFGAETLGRSNVEVVTDGNATLGTVDALASLAVLAKGTTSTITGTTLTAGEDIALKSTSATTVASAIARDDVVVTAGTLADLDIVTAQGGGSDSRDVTFTSGIGFAATTKAGGSDIAVSGQSADVITANASRDLSISASTGGLSLVDGVAGRFATLDKTGSASDLRISGNLSAGSTVTIGSTTDILLASGKTVSSTAGSIGVTATRSIFGLAGQSAAPAVPEIGTLTTTGDLTLTGAGDVRADTLTAGGALGVTIGGSLTGSGAGTAVASVVGGNLSAAAAGQSVTVVAGNAAGNVAYLDTIVAGGDVNVAANGIGINSVTAGGTLTLTAGGGGLNLGTGMAGTAAINVGGAPLALPPLFSADETLDARFGASNLTAGTGITVNVASGLAQIGTAMAGSDISLTGLALSVDKAVSANGALGMSATGGALYLGEGAAGLGVSLTKSGGTDPNDELRVKRTLSGVQSVVINSDTNVRLGSVSSSTGDVSVRSTGDTTGNAGGRADLSASAAGKSVTVTAGSLALLGTVQAGQDVSLTATGTVDVTSATATGGNATASAGSVLAGSVTAGSAVSIVAGSGQLTLGTGIAGTTATLTKSGASGELQLTNTLTSGGDTTINSSTNARLGSVAASAGAVNVTSTLATTGIAGPSIGTSDSGFGRANLSAGAGKSVTVTSGALAQLGTVVAGQNVTVTAGNAVGNGAVDVTAATATAGALKLAARAVSPTDAINDGDVLLGTGSSGTSSTLTNKENGGAAGNVLVANALTAGSSVTIDAAGSVTGGTVDANGGDTTITAGPLVDLAVAEASGKVSATAGSVILGRATAGSALELTADSGQLTLGTGTAGTTATLIKRTTAAGDLQVTNSLVASGKVTIDSATNAGLKTIQSTADNIDVTSAQIALTGAMTVGADKTVTLTNRADAAGNKTVLGDAASSAGDFTLTDAELDLVSAPNLVISSGVKNVALGAFSLKGATGAKTLKLLSTNGSNISLAGVISEEAATARDVQIGGTQSASPALIPATTAANELAATIFATTTADAGGRILLPNATVELRAAKIIFGLGASGTPGGLIDQARNLTADAVANMFVSRPDSVLYNPIPGYTQTDAGRTILSATKLTIRYTDFTLFQNTAPAGLTAGLVLQRPGAAPGPSGQARLVLFSTSEAPKNSIALFGTIDGVIGNAAALLTTEIDTANGTRISRSSSRLNGCGIGSPEQGCLTTQSPPPQLRLFDERQALVFRTADDSVLPFDPLVSTNNEALFIDFGGVSLPYDEADCVPGAAAASCPQPGDKK